MVRILCALLLLAGACQAATIIGQEARIDLPLDAAYNIVVNNSPGDGQTVILNPPLISWSYTLNPSNAVWDGTVYRFTFQAAYEPTFTNPIINVTCWQPAYNTLAPFTNDITPASNVVFWRVYYSCTNQYLRNPANMSYYESAITADFRTNAVSDVHWFMVSDSAATWDRSMLANETYLLSKADHPRIWFNSTNKASVYAWLEGGTESEAADWGKAVGGIKQQAYYAITQSWWGLSNATTVIDRYDWARQLANCALVYALSGDGTFTNSPTNLCQRVSDFACVSIGNRWETLEPVTFASIPITQQAMCVLYDWLYHDFTASQRSNVLFALEKMCRFAIKGGGAFETPTKSGIVWTSDDPLTGWTNTFTAEGGSLFKIGNNHPPYYAQTAFWAALAAYDEGTWARRLFDRWINLALAKPFWFGANDGSMNCGRGYNVVNFFDQPSLLGMMMAEVLFPEAELRRNPIWSGGADWSSRMFPVGFYQANEPWGDEGSGSHVATMSTRHVGRDLALFTQLPYVWMHHTNSSAYRPRTVNETAFRIPIMYHFTRPGSYVDATNSGLFPAGGWVMGSTHEPNTTRGYLGGSGFILAARPSGWVTPGNLHNHPCDLNFQLWAYGAPITDSGYNAVAQSKLPWLHYAPLYNGLGPIRHGIETSDGVAAKIIAYTNSGYFIYVAVDGRQAFPLAPAIGGAAYGASFAGYNTPIPLTTMQRHLLYVRNKYWVILDDWAAGTAATYSFVWHVPRQSLNLAADGDLGTFSYESTNGYSGQRIKVMAQSFLAPEYLSFTNLGYEIVTNGTQRSVPALVNPVTGEDYTGRFVIQSTGSQPTPAGAANSARIYMSFKWLTDLTTNIIIYWVTNVDQASNAYVLRGDTPDATLTNTANALEVFPWFRTNLYELTWQSATQFTVYPSPNITYSDASSSYSALKLVKYNQNFSLRTAALWWGNSTPDTAWRSAWVIYAVTNGASEPTFTRIDDYTLAITNGTEGDVISFDTNSVEATIIVDVGATNAIATPQVAAPTFSLASGSVVTFPTNITLSCATVGATLLYVTNGVTNAGSVVSMSYAGQQLIVWATNSGYRNSDHIFGQWTTNAPMPPPPVGTTGTPVFTPSPGTYTNFTFVSIDSSTDGAEIYYTTDGVTVPTTNQWRWLSPLLIDTDTTFLALAVMAGLSNSALATGVYLIESEITEPRRSGTVRQIGRANTVILK